ncbi:hypothetical protein BH11ARM1_BH11ARM1_03880 [soil metagenome]
MPSLVEFQGDQELQELVAYTSKILESPVFLVTVLNETEQIFIAKTGVEVDSTSLNESFCVHAIGHEGIFEVTDATKDPRFATNPLVTGPLHVRYYAGIPFESPAGDKGALCVLDTRPRELNDLQRATFLFLSTQFQNWMRRRQGNLESEAHRNVYQLANVALETESVHRLQLLNKAVAEAEAFNYSVSHDLRAPLRAIVSTSSILLDELGDSLSEEHHRLLTRQKHNATRLGNLIDDLLRLSRLARVDLNLQQVDLTELCHTICTDIQRSCEVEIQPDMKILGDPSLLVVILQNLIENACKFSNGKDVKVAMEGETISVTDEGIGFDMSYTDRIFMPFERLVSDNDYVGTGIGLASAKKAAERHGGAIWVESEPGKGSTFYVRLSANPA